MARLPALRPRLGVNLDHVATLRQARGTAYPDLAQAIEVTEAAGADGITLHLREDRRHIQDRDMEMARRIVSTTLNMEMAATDEMLSVACRIKPDFCCIVPERREELTTEGGLDVLAHEARLRHCCTVLREAGIAVSLFIEPELPQIDAAARIGAPLVELHTGAYAESRGAAIPFALQRLGTAAIHAAGLGLQVNAGHGLEYQNVCAVAAIPEIAELNIGHAIVSRAVFTGLAQAVQDMRAAMWAGQDGDGAQP
jgi:pyridoxine 5-phosphate synthase